MTGAIDACAAESRDLGPDDTARRSEAFRAKAPTLLQFGDRFIDAVSPLLA